MNTTPFSLRIFVADGDPDGLRIVEKSNWIGKALVFPRALLRQVKAQLQLAQTGERFRWRRRLSSFASVLIAGCAELMCDKAYLGTWFAFV
jgi:hypothetical protein